MLRISHFSAKYRIRLAVTSPSYLVTSSESHCRDILATSFGTTGAECAHLNAIGYLTPFRYPGAIERYKFSRRFPLAMQFRTNLALACCLPLNSLCLFAGFENQSARTHGTKADFSTVRHGNLWPSGEGDCWPGLHREVAPFGVVGWGNSLRLAFSSPFCLY